MKSVARSLILNVEALNLKKGLCMPQLNIYHSIVAVIPLNFNSSFKMQFPLNMEEFSIWTENHSFSETSLSEECGLIGEHESEIGLKYMLGYQKWELPHFQHCHVCFICYESFFFARLKLCYKDVSSKKIVSNSKHLASDHFEPHRGNGVGGCFITLLLAVLTLIPCPLH